MVIVDILILALSMIGKLVCADKSVFELTIDKPLGVLGCRRMCNDRRACLDVNYSTITMSCTLRFNSSLRHSANRGADKVCRKRYCVHRSVHTESGRNVNLEEQCHGSCGNPPKYEEIKLSFTQDSGGWCKSHGMRLDNIVEQRPTSSSGNQMYRRCLARSVQEMNKHVNYSWVVSAKPTSTGKSATAIFTMPSMKRKSAFRVCLTFDSSFKLVSGRFERSLGGKLDTKLKFMLSEGFIHFIDLKNNVKVDPFKAMYPLANYFHIKIRCIGMKMVFD